VLLSVDVNDLISGVQMKMQDDSIARTVVLLAGKLDRGPQRSWESET